MAGKAGRRHRRAGQSSSTARDAAIARGGASLGGKSYEELYVEHAPAARLVALSLVPADVADDIVADAFVRVLAAIRAGGGPDHAFRAYLLTAVRNLAYDWLSARRRVTVLGDLDEEAGDLAAGFSGGAESQAEARAEARLILRAFSRLPERWRTVLWHLEVEGKAPADMAPAFGLSPNGVSALAMRAREGLRQAYLQEHIGTNIPAACRAYAAELGAGTRGRLSPRRQEAMQEHLRQCPACANLFTELSELNSKLGTILAPIALAGASAVLRSGRHAVLRAGLTAQSRSLRWHPVTAVTGAAAGVAVAGGMIFAVNITPVTGSPPHVTGSPPHVTARPADPRGATPGPAAGKTAPGRHRSDGGGGGRGGTPAGSGIPAVSAAGSPPSPAGLAPPPALAAVPPPGATVTGLTSTAGATVAGLADTVSTATAGLSDTVSTAVTGLGQTASTTITGVTNTAATTVNQATSLVTTTVTGATSTVSSTVAATAASTTSTVAATVTGATSTAGAAAANLASTAGSTVANTASTATNAVTSTATTANTAAST